MQPVYQRQKWPKYTFIAAVLIFVVMGGLFLIRQHEVVRITIDQKVFRARVVRDKVAQAKGLAGKESLDDDAALLIVADSEERQPVWMKDMKFPIDVIWLDSNKRVVHRETALRPDSYPMTYGPAQPTRYVIELPAYTSEASNLKSGEVIGFNIKDSF